MSARPLISVRKVDGADGKDQLVMPSVFLAPIRPDVVHFVHTNMAKNKRQAYAVAPEAGHQHSAESWGTGRAVARIPRVSGGGTSRAGQGAFGNMCRKGRMFAPTKTWRKWHRKINTNQKRFAVASALAASALPALVMARGHKVEEVPEIPLVIDSALESVQKTKQAIATLKAVGAYVDVEKAKESRKLRRGVGKMRNRRHVNRRGPLVIYNEDQGIVQAFRNLPGVELCAVSRLNLLQLAPGGHLGRFVVWTRGAFEQLNGLWGSVNRESTQKVGYKLPQPMMANSDLTRLINSDEIQSRVNPAKTTVKRRRLKKNPIKNLGVMVRLNPYALSLRRSEALTQERRAAKKAASVDAARKKLPVERTAEQKTALGHKKAHRARQSVNYARLTHEDKEAPKSSSRAKVDRYADSKPAAAAPKAAEAAKAAEPAKPAAKAAEPAKPAAKAAEPAKPAAAAPAKGKK